MTGKYSRRDFLRNIGIAGALSLIPNLEALADENKESKYKTSDFTKDREQVLLARMLFGEARDCSELEKVAIAYTAINRANDGKRYNGETLREAILKPHQYSCFNENDKNREKLMDPEKYEPKAFAECLAVAQKVLQKKYSDPTNGATHYFNPEIVKKPTWADKMKKIGRIKINDKKYSKHEFYRE